MAIESTDVKLRLTAPAAEAGDEDSSTPSGSLGGFVATTEIVDSSIHHLFDAVSGAENAAEDVEYRCFAVVNTHATDSWTDVTAWIASQVSGGAGIAIGLDPEAVGAKETAEAAIVANESSAPAGATFSTPTSGSPLSIGDLDAGECKFIWVRRTALDSAAVSNDGAVISFTGTST